MGFYYYCPKCKKLTHGGDKDGEFHGCTVCGSTMHCTDVSYDCEWDKLDENTEASVIEKMCEQFPPEPDGYVFGVKVGDFDKCPPIIKDNIEEAILCDALTQTSVTRNGRRTTFRARFGGKENLGAISLLIQTGLVRNESELHDRIERINSKSMQFIQMSHLVEGAILFAALLLNVFTFFDNSIDLKTCCIGIGISLLLSIVCYFRSQREYVSNRMAAFRLINGGTDSSSEIDAIFKGCELLNQPRYKHCLNFYSVISFALLVEMVTVFCIGYFR